MVKKREIIAIIPARGGSKGLPKKNIKELNGRPLIYYSISFAKNSKYITQVIVSTEDPKIAEISRKFGAFVINRPNELATDTSPVIFALKHVLDTIKKKPYCVVLVQPTSPIRSDDTLKNMLKLYDKNKDTVITVVKKDNPRMGYVKDNQYIPINYKMGQRRQDIDEIYQENGNLYVLNPDDILENKLFSEKICCYVINGSETIDIDTEFEFKLAEFYMRQENENI